MVVGMQYKYPYWITPVLNLYEEIHVIAITYLWLEWGICNGLLISRTTWAILCSEYIQWLIILSPMESFHWHMNYDRSKATYIIISTCLFEGYNVEILPRVNFYMKVKAILSLMWFRIYSENIYHLLLYSKSFQNLQRPIILAGD